MGKSIRSKIKRKNRTEFRQTIGKGYVEANRSIIQANLRECIEKGSMNCLDRVSSLLSTDPPPDAQVRVTVEDDSMDVSDGIGAGKRQEKVAVRAKRTKKRRATRSPWQKKDKSISSFSKKDRSKKGGKKSR